MLPLIFMYQAQRSPASDYDANVRSKMNINPDMNL